MGNRGASRYPSLRRAWQLDMDAEAAIRIGARPHAAAMSHDDRAADGEAHAQSLGLGGDEVLEDMLELCVPDPGAGVHDFEHQPTGSRLPGPEGDEARARRSLDRFAGV